MTTEEAINLRGLPKGLRAMYKAAMARRGKTIKAGILEHMREAVRNDGKLKGVSRGQGKR